MSFFILTVFLLLVTCGASGSSIRVSDAELNTVYGDPYVDCIDVQTCANCRGAGGSAQFRTLDGTCNNIQKPTQGAANTKHRRYLDSDYLVGTTGYPRGFDPYSQMKSAHSIAREAFESLDTDKGNHQKPHSTSIMFMSFGQFIDHDISVTSHASSAYCEPSCADGSITEFQYPCNPLRLHAASSHTNRCTLLTRTRAACQNGNNTDNHREQVNRLTSYVDGSAVYGSDDARAQFLRTLDGTGRLRVTDKNLMPEFPELQELCNSKGLYGCFASGDNRSAENIALASIHTLFVREHNRIAVTLKELNPFWSGSQIFYTSRRIVAAEIQHILLKEWLPLVTGDIDPIGYHDNIDSTISNVFSHAAFRFGHTLIPDKLHILNNNFDYYGDKHTIPLREAYFNIQLVKDIGIEDLLYGMMGNKSEAFDMSFSAAVARHLYMPLGKDGLADLSAINIHRGRDHGLPSYMKWRSDFCRNLEYADENCDVHTIQDWDDLVKSKDMSEQTVENLKKVYNSIHDIDIFVGGVAEKPVGEKVVGKTFGCIMKKQFEDLFKGDRYFYTNFMFTSGQFLSIKNVKFRQILCDNLEGVTSLHDSPFLAFKKSSMNRKACVRDYTDASYEGVNLDFWKDTAY